MASIDKRPNGSYRARWREFPSGPQRTKHFTRKIDARRFLDALAGDMVRGTYRDPKLGRSTFGDLASKAEAARVNRRSTTRARDATLMRTRVLPTFEKRAVGDITPADVRGWAAGLEAAGLAPTTIRKCYQLLARVFDDAVEDGILAVSPCRRVPLPRHDSPEPQLLRPDEVDRLATVLPDRYRALVVTAAYTGLR